MNPERKIKIPVKGLLQKLPAVGDKGEVYYDEVSNYLLISDASRWIPLAGINSVPTSQESRSISSSVVANSVQALNILTIPSIRVTGSPVPNPGSLAYDVTTETVYYSNQSIWKSISGISSISAADNTIVIGGTSANPTIRGNYVSGSGISIVGNVITNSSPAITYSAGSGISIVGTIISNTSPGINYSAGTGISIVGTTISGNYVSGSGISIVGNTISNTSPAISYSAGTGISIIGTTISNTGVTSLVAGSGISVSGSTGSVTITNSSPAISYSAGTGISIVGTVISGDYTAGSGISIIGNIIANTSPGISYSAGTGISIVGTTISNTSPGISYSAGTGISIVGTTISNTGVTSLVAGSGISITNVGPGLGDLQISSTGGGVASFQTSLSGLSPSIATTGAVTLSGTLGYSSGGTGLTGPFSNGQLLIGNGTGLTAANLSAGSGISITNGAGSIQISSTSGSVSSVTAGLDMTVSPTIGNVVVTQTQRKSVTFYSPYYQTFGNGFTGAGSNAAFYAVVTSSSYSPTGPSNLFTGYSVNTGGIPSNAPLILTSTNPLSTDLQGWHCNVSGLYLLSYTLAISSTSVTHSRAFWAAVFENAALGWGQVPGSLTQAVLAPDTSQVSVGGSQGLMSTTILFHATSGNSYNLCLAGYDPVFLPGTPDIALGSQTQMGPGPAYGPPVGFAGGGVISSPTVNTTASITFTYMQATT